MLVSRIFSFPHYVFSTMNPLSNTKILNLTQVKAYADDNLKETETLKVLSGTVKNIVGKVENAGFQHFPFFPHNVFKKLLNSFPNKLWFLCVCSISLLKTLWEKEKSLVTSNFFFSRSVFYPFGEDSAICIKFEIVVSDSFSLEESKICFFGKG